MKKVLFLAITFCLVSISMTAGGIKTDYRNALILAYSQANSVYEDDNIKLEIYDGLTVGYQQNQENDFYRFGSVLLFPQRKSKTTLRSITEQTGR